MRPECGILFFLATLFGARRRWDAEGLDRIGEGGVGNKVSAGRAFGYRQIDAGPRRFAVGVLRGVKKKRARPSTARAEAPPYAVEDWRVGLPIETSVGGQYSVGSAPFDVGATPQPPSNRSR